MLRKLCAQGKIDIHSLKLRIPDIALVDDSGLGTPPTASVTSTVSTSSLHLDRMTMESPSPQLMGPPIAGPSGANRGKPKAKGTCSCSLLYIQFLMIEAVNAVSASAPNLRSRSGQRGAATVPPSKAASVSGSRQSSRNRNA
jgi:hypothetical protein